MFSEIIGFFSRIAFGVWGIICWLESAWFELIGLVFLVLGWLSVLLSMYFLLTSQWIIGSIIFAVAMLFLIGRESCKLISFWLSGKEYLITPAAFVGDILGSIMAFVMLFGILFGTWYFIYPEQWLFVISAALVPIIIIYSVSHVIKNFLAMIKSKLSGKPKEKK